MGIFKNLFEDLPIKKTLLFLIVLSFFTTIVYHNHFNNSFHFDDSHTIENNVYIRELKNIPKFFKDGSTFSSLPSNQSYRPVVSTSLAIDYWLGKGYNLFYFHLSTFILFLVQAWLMFFMTYKIFQLSYKNNWNFYIAAAATTWYTIHPANAETVNYIIARSDIQSTIAVVAALVMYQYSSFSKKYFLYLIPVIIGALAKPPSVMFLPILFFYVLLFEKDISLSGAFNFNKKGKIVLQTIIGTIPAFIICVITYWWIDHKTPETWESGGLSRWDYLITQPFVIFYYFITFFLPFGLNADTDWQTLQTIWDIKFIVGILFIISMIVIAIWFSKDKRLRPISFGIIWFFFALIPTSSIIPFSEVMNDHRMYFPFVGLAISICWAIGLLLLKIKNNAKENAEKIVKWQAVFVLLLLCGYAFGVYERNKVWKNDETLWYDVTIKSPKNGRGLMNYGLAKMQKAEYAEAEKYFFKALEITPLYPYLHVNIGVLKEATGDATTAEIYFKNGINYGSQYPECWYYYGKFLNNQQRFQEAIPILNNAISLFSAHMPARNELMRAYYYSNQMDKLKQLAEGTLQLSPDDVSTKQFIDLINSGKMPANTYLSEEEIKKNPTPEKYLQLSLQYYQNNDYTNCINAALEALKINSNYAEAYNNIGSGYIKLQQYEKAIVALQKALELKPNFELAKNNLMHAIRLSATGNQNDKIPVTADDFLSLSLTYYNQGEYEKCIEACEKAIKIKPDFSDAYNNICSAYNQLKMWDKAIDACNKALQHNPNHELAKGNLNWAKQNKK